MPSKKARKKILPPPEATTEGVPALEILIKRDKIHTIPRQYKNTCEHTIYYPCCVPGYDPVSAPASAATPSSAAPVSGPAPVYANPSAYSCFCSCYSYPRPLGARQ